MAMVGQIWPVGLELDTCFIDRVNTNLPLHPKANIIIVKSVTIVDCVFCWGFLAQTLQNCNYG